MSADHQPDWRKHQIEDVHFVEGREITLEAIEVGTIKDGERYQRVMILAGTDDQGDHVSTRWILPEDMLIELIVGLLATHGEPHILEAVYERVEQRRR